MTKEKYEKLKEERGRNIPASFLEIYQKQENCFWCEGEVFCADSTESINWIDKNKGDIMLLDDYIALASGQPIAYKAVIFIENEDKLPVIS